MSLLWAFLILGVWGVGGEEARLDKCVTATVGSEQILRGMAR